MRLTRVWGEDRWGSWYILMFYIYTVLYIAQEGASLISEFYKYKLAPAIVYLHIYDAIFTLLIIIAPKITLIITLFCFSTVLSIY